MYEKLQKSFAAMTRGADMHYVVLNSLVVAIASTLFSLPYFHYLIFQVSSEGLFQGGNYSYSLLLTQLFLLFILSLLSAMIGFSFSKRFEFPGFGDLKGFTRSMPYLIMGGAVMIILSFFLYDRYFFEISPISYPKGILYLISLPVKGAFTDEIILRFCLVTIATGLLKSKSAGVGIVSAFASLIAIKYFHFIGVNISLNYLFLTHIFFSFLVNFVLGYLYVTKGLIYSMALGFFFNLKYIFVSWLMRG
jgi:hypothetical protein